MPKRRVLKEWKKSRGIIVPTIVGIDPGKNGGIVFMIPNFDPQLNKIPETSSDLIDCFTNWNLKLDNSVVFLEKVHAGPKMGSSAAFKFGKGVGVLEGVIACLGLSLELVSPQKWQSKMGVLSSGRGLGQGDTAKKKRNREKARQLFPGLEITNATADALLIAEYGRRLLAGELA